MQALTLWQRYQSKLSEVSAAVEREVEAMAEGRYTKVRFSRRLSARRQGIC